MAVEDLRVLRESFKPAKELVYGHTRTPKNGGATEVFISEEALGQLEKRQIVKGKIRLPKKVKLKELIVRVKDDRVGNEVLYSYSDYGVLITLTYTELAIIQRGESLSWNNRSISVRKEIL